MLLCAFNMLSAAHLLQLPNDLPLYLWPWSNGAFCLLTMSGVVTAQLLLTGQRNGKLALFFALGLLLTGALATPLGISKIRATPTWSIVSAGASVLLFLFLYWI